MRFAFMLSLSLIIILGFQSPQQDFSVKQKELVDLNGDGNKEVVELLNKKDEHDYENEWKLTVDGKQVGVFDNKDGTYLAATMEFKNLLNNGRQEILLYLVSGGSGGTTGLNVLSLDRAEPKLIFNDPNKGYNFDAEASRKRFTIEYKGNYQVAFTDNESGLTTVIVLSKDRYNHLPQETANDLLNKMKPWVDPVSNYEIIEVTSDKPKEIVTVQAVSGVSHVDTIGLFKTKYMYDDGSQTYIPVEVALYNDANQQLAAKKLQ